MQIAMTYIGVVLIWSTTPLGITYSVDSLDYIQGSALRMWLSLGVCFILLKILRVRFPTHKAALMSYGAGAVGVLGAMLCTYWAAGKVPSGLMAVLWGLSPMMVTIFSAWLLPGKNFSWAKLFSIALAIGGLALVFSGQINVATSMILGLLVLLVGVKLHAYSAVLIQKLQVEVHPLAQTTGALAVAAPGYAIAWFFMSGPLPETISVKSVFGVLYLATIGSVVGFMAYFYLLKKLSAASVSLTTLITPVIALVLGAVLENEQLPIETWLGAGVIMMALLVYNKDALLNQLPKLRRSVMAYVK